MAIQILPREGSFGQTLGTGLGSALSSGLGALAHSKLQQMHTAQMKKEKDHRSSAYQQILGEELGKNAEYLPPDALKALLQNPAAARQLSQLLGAEGMGHPSQQHNFQEQSSLRSIPGLSPQNTQSSGINSLIPENRLLPLLALAQSQKQNKDQQPPLAELAPQVQENMAQRPQEVKDKVKKEKLFEEAFKTPQQKALEAREKQDALKARAAEEKETRKEELERRKFNKEFVHTTLNNEKSAKQNDIRINRMEELIDNGKLPNASLWSFLNKIEDQGALSTGGAGGIIGGALGSILPGAGTAAGAGAGAALGALIGSIAGPLAGSVKTFIRSGSPDIEEFEKLSADFIKNAKQFFGSRVTDFDLRSFMLTIPNLAQTDAGKKRIISNFRKMNDIVKKEGEITRKVLKDNKGVPPFDLETQVYERLQPDIDDLAQIFKPKEQH